MAEKISRNGHPPKWWTRVIDDLEHAVMAAKKSYLKPGTILGKKLDDDGNLIGYYIRLKNSKIGYYKRELMPRVMSVGVIIKNELPHPHALSEIPSITTFARATLRENVKLLPVRWLHDVLDKMLRGSLITPEQDFREFSQWLALPYDKKDDKALIDILYRVTKYEGILGLARFNSYALPD